MTLREQIHAASELNASASRLLAVAELKASALDREVARELCDYLQDDLHPAERTTVAQVLGFHKSATRFSEVGAALHAQAELEDDVIALRALVFALQGCEAVTQFLTHRDEGVVLEAVVNAPANTQSLQALLHVAFEGLQNRPFEALCGRLADFEDIVPHVVAFLMTAEFREGGGRFDDRVRHVFSELPQPLLFEALVDVRGDLERTYKQIWPGIWRRERQRRLLEQFVEMLANHEVDSQLIEVVLSRVVADEQSYGDYVRIVRGLLGVFNTKAALTWIAACKRLGEKADRTLLSRLAETLVTLVRSAPLIVDEAQAVLALWEPQLPGVRMKAFHAAR
jgi:hypothetical protein